MAERWRSNFPVKNSVGRSGPIVGLACFVPLRNREAGKASKNGVFKWFWPHLVAKTWFVDSQADFTTCDFDFSEYFPEKMIN